MKNEQVEAIVHDLVRLLSFSRVPSQHQKLEKKFVLDYARRAKLDSEYDGLFIQHLVSTENIPHLKQLAQKLSLIKNDLTSSASIMANYQESEYSKSGSFKFSVSLVKAESWPTEFLTVG